MGMAVIYFDIPGKTWNMIKFGFAAYSSAEYESFLLGIKMQFILAFPTTFQKFS
jgi:hypothetical protein